MPVPVVDPDPGVAAGPRGRLLETEQWVPVTLDRTFAFFADAGNLESLTAALLQFRIVTPMPIALRAGAHIENRLRLFGAPVRWLTRIDAWDPDRENPFRGPRRLG